MAKVKTKPAKHLRGGLDVTPPPAAKRKARRTADEQRINRILDVILSVCSGQWRDAIVGDTKGEIQYPVPGMVLSRCKVLTTGDMVSNNAGELGTRRWHPAITDTLEDGLDRMEIKQAGRYVHPPAVRYDHMTPYREAVVYDPRSIRVDDPDAWILRTTKLADWQVARTNIRIRRGRKVIGFESSCWAFGVLDLAAEPVVESYIQVTE